jgi:hypothetical protein|tara:strand:+ start:297 stop:563 length:267 start_codon:yes stop_codon:yes gene_type:complete
MAYGLQLRDAAGNLTLDISDRVGFFVATLSGTVSGTTNITVAGISAATTYATLMGAFEDDIDVSVTVGTNTVQVAGTGAYKINLVRFS